MFGDQKTPKLFEIFMEVQTHALWALWSSNTTPCILPMVAQLQHSLIEKYFVWAITGFVPSLWWCKCSIQEIPSDLCRWRWQFKIRTYVLLFQSTFFCLFVSIPKKVYGKNESDSPLPCILNSNSFWFSARKSLTQYCRSIFSFPFPS